MAWAGRCEEETALEPTVAGLIGTASEGDDGPGGGDAEARASAAALLSATGYTGSPETGVGIFVTAQKAVSAALSPIPL